MEKHIDAAEEVCASAVAAKHIAAAEEICASAVAERHIAAVGEKEISLVAAVALTFLDFLSVAEEELEEGPKAYLCKTPPEDQSCGRNRLIFQICYHRHEAKTPSHAFGESCIQLWRVQELRPFSSWKCLYHLED